MESSTNTLSLCIPKTSGSTLELDLCSGDRVFVVGANGAGKSALIQHVASKHAGRKIERIMAHRQTWLRTGSIDITAENSKRMKPEIAHRDQSYDSLWSDNIAQERISSLLFDLVSQENARARCIVSLVDNQQYEKASIAAKKSPSPFSQLNDLLALGTLKISLQNSSDDEIQAERKDNESKYSMSQMSDGERNAALIAAKVVTADSNTIFLIDEPERHLHRSIIEPFLSALFRHRDDCIFVISTHEISLPVANDDAHTILVRSCSWSGREVASWDIELIQPNSNLPEDLKRAILGSRKKILFVEGDNSSSLDLPIYNALFPNVTIIPKGGCANVMQAVQGLRGSIPLHDVEAYGLIDRDNLTLDEIDQLAQKNIFALKVCSIESLCYCSDAISAVAHRQAESLGYDAEELIINAKQKALQILGKPDVANRLAAKRCERQIRNLVFTKTPNWKTIKDNTTGNFTICVPSPLQEEIDHFNDLLNNNDLDALVARYPIKKSSVLRDISHSLHLTNERSYYQTLLTQIQTCQELAQKLRNHVHPLSKQLT